MVQLLDEMMDHDRKLIAGARDEASTLAHAAATSKVDLPQESVPGYELVRRIGAGGQGTVYEAIQTSTGRRVALKAVRSDGAGGSRWARCEREVHLLARMQHPHIVTVYDSIRHGDCFYFAMQLVDGQPLTEHVLHSGIDRKSSLELFAKVCDAVHAAHQRGVIHRDLKPANILVDEAGAPHVLDFGLAKPTLEMSGDSATAGVVSQAGEFLGTIAWASPEQVRGNPDDLDIRTDVYSLGVTLYELITGVPPYDTNGPLQEAIESIVRTQPRRPSAMDRSIDDDLETMILILQRYNSVQRHRIRLLNMKPWACNR